MRSQRMDAGSNPARDTKIIIKTPVPSAEEMAARLGLSKKRLAAIRAIMNRPASKAAARVKA